MLQCTFVHTSDMSVMLCLFCLSGGLFVGAPDDPPRSAILNESALRFYVQQYSKSGFRYIYSKIYSLFIVSFASDDFTGMLENSMGVSCTNNCFIGKNVCAYVYALLVSETQCPESHTMASSFFSSARFRRLQVTCVSVQPQELIIYRCSFTTRR